MRPFVRAASRESRGSSRIPAGVRSSGRVLAVPAGNATRRFPPAGHHETRISRNYSMNTWIRIFNGRNGLVAPGQMHNAPPLSRGRRSRDPRNQRLNNFTARLKARLNGSAPPLSSSCTVLLHRVVCMRNEPLVLLVFSFRDARVDNGGSITGPGDSR